MTGQAATEAFYAALLDDDPEELYERAPCGYLTTTPDGMIVKANTTFATLSGYDRDDLVGRRTFAALLSAGGRIYHETHFAPTLRMHGTVGEVAFDLVRRDGDRLPVLVNAVLEAEADGTPKLVRIAVFDATHRRAYERELLLAKQRAERSEARAQALARTLQSTLIPPVATDTSPGWTCPPPTAPQAMARRSAATSTTSSRSSPATGSSRSATSAARGSTRRW